MMEHSEEMDDGGGGTNGEPTDLQQVSSEQVADPCEEAPLFLDEFNKDDVLSDLTKSLRVILDTQHDTTDDDCYLQEALEAMDDDDDFYAMGQGSTKLAML
eukprot:CAMPEP_0185745548 /NCGR_PEP_ID=MMETSP1174-20130828/3908_1 /TAXON_ID=35687 /ORGANISM="Dictyocha speculum, Strain CCMP1381" /LENGTH=100 /DNA_ID=CAMNT_0028419623 /DNA_START=6 /DNA_END=309 /DNA_ORIENTATION=+